ncbi:hypothetical protein PROPHIGD12-2_41 [Mycobacterium phage prophiGD12-2]|nr:hypothetical protein PROPHIGD12-2_41 [Mycobacterium phage prophiGD12-2]
MISLSAKFLNHVRHRHNPIRISTAID